LRKERKRLDKGEKMRRFVVFNLLFLNFLLFSDDNILTEINKTHIKIGEKITLLTKIKDLKDAEVLWQDITPSDASVDTLSKKDFFKDNYLNLEIIFTFFNSGEYKDFFYTIPIKERNGEMIYLETKKINITVDGFLSEEDKNNIRNITDPSKIELRKEKDQEKFSFKFGFILLIILGTILLIIVGLIIYYLLHKYLTRLNPKDNEFVKNLPPYEKFLYDIERVSFNVNDERVVVEEKLSILTEALKELITNEFKMNAISETTKELILNLRDINFDPQITNEINRLFNEIDMVKFAKAFYDYDRLLYYYNTIKELGSRVNCLYKEKIAIENENQIKKEEKDK